MKPWQVQRPERCGNPRADTGMAECLEYVYPTGHGLQGEIEGNTVYGKKGDRVPE